MNKTMSLKKILILPVGFILLHTLYIGCCKCVDGSFYKDITSLGANENGDRRFFSKDSVIVIDTLFASLNINFNWVTQNKPNPFAGFINAAYATSCKCNTTNDLGFKYKIDSLVITSNTTFKGVPSGNDISSLFKGLYYSNTSINPTYMPVAQLLDSISTSKYVYGINFITTATNVINKTHKFSYKLYSNNKVYDAFGTKLVVFQ